MLAHFVQTPLSRRHNFDPDTIFVSGFAYIHQIFLYSMQATYLNSSVRLGQNICLISVRHGRSCSSRHQNLKPLQLPKIFQHKAASIEQHLLPQHSYATTLSRLIHIDPFKKVSDPPWLQGTTVSVLTTDSGIKNLLVDSEGGEETTLPYNMRHKDPVA